MGLLGTLMENRLSRKYLKSLPPPYDYEISEDQKLIYNGAINNYNVQKLMNKNAFMLSSYINLDRFNGEKWDSMQIHWKQIRENAKEHGYNDGFRSDSEAAYFVMNSMNRGYYKYFIFIGLGGFIGNMIYMMNLAAIRTSRSIRTPAQFFENDIVTLDNVYRMLYEIHPGTAEQIATVYEEKNIRKIHGLDDTGEAISEILMSKSARSDTIPKSLYTLTKMSVMKNYIVRAFEKKYAYEKRFDEESIEHIIGKSIKNKIAFIGSPDFETRRILDKHETDFYFFGHHGRETEIIYRPKTESDVAVETYGQMEVTEFWAGIYAMMMEFLKWNTTLKEKNSIDEKEYKGEKQAEYDYNTGIMINYGNGCGLEPGSTLSHFKSERRKCSGDIYPSEFKRNFEWNEFVQEEEEEEEV